MSGQKFGGYGISERPSYARHFQAVGQPVVYEDAARQGENLRLVLQSAEGGGEDKAVVIPLKLRTVLVSLLMKLFQSEAFGGYKCVPIHPVLVISCK